MSKQDTSWSICEECGETVAEGEDLCNNCVWGMSPVRDYTSTASTIHLWDDEPVQP